MLREELLPLTFGLLAAALAAAWLNQDPWPREQVPVLSVRSESAPAPCAGSACWLAAQGALPE